MASTILSRFAVLVRHDGSGWWSFVLLSVLPLLGPQGSWAVEPQVRLVDVYQTLEARKLLVEDELLGPLNVGVKVQNRVAVLWGPIPSTDLSLRAERRLRTLFELTEVRNELFVHGEDPVLPGPLFAPTPLPWEERRRDAGSPLGPATPLYLPEPAPPGSSPIPQKTPLPLEDPTRAVLLVHAHS